MSSENKLVRLSENKEEPKTGIKEDSFVYIVIPYEESNINSGLTRIAKNSFPQTLRAHTHTHTDICMTLKYGQKKNFGELTKRLKEHETSHKLRE